MSQSVPWWMMILGFLLVLGPLGFVYSLLFGTIYLAATIAAFVFAAGFGAREPEEATLFDDEDETPGSASGSTVAP